MAKPTADNLIERGLRAAESPLATQVMTWARYTDEKADIAASLARTIRAMLQGRPVEQGLRALSIGSSTEPQFRLLHAFFQNGLYLFDIDETALAVIAERLERQMIEGVFGVQGDYVRDFADERSARATLDAKLGGEPFELINLHHCFYYCDAKLWPAVITSLYQAVLAPGGAMHVALMSARETREETTTWLYNHFAGKFFGTRTDHDLLSLPEKLSNSPAFADARFQSETRQVHFWVDDFDRYMAVVWMIMLYPDGHAYTFDQRTQIVEFVLEHFWLPRRPLIQTQDYLSIFKRN